jgi:excinuclease ABC subunit A
MSLKNEIVIKGAREHNLQNVSISIPRHKITVFTGLSGSGKSSLAFETIYAEGHRRYIESLSNYARQFLDSMKKPDVDSVTGLTPAIAIDQKTVSLNPRSTVGTVTEVYDFLRLLFAKLGVPECPEHKTPLSNQTPQQIINDILKIPEGSKFFILAPMAQSQKGEFLNEFQKWIKKGFVKARIDGQMVELALAKKLAKHKAHDIDLVIDQMIMKDSLKERLSMSINTALGLAQGRVVIEVLGGKRKMYSLKAVCPECGFSFPELEPRLWSFNHPRGACRECKGLGTLDLVEESEFGVSDEGSRKLTRVQYHLKNQAENKARTSKKNGDEDEETDSMQMKFRVCKTCRGTRLNSEALSVCVDEKNIAELAHLSLVDLKAWLDTRKWSDRQSVIAEKIMRPLKEKLDYLLRVGTGYLSVDRSVRTLSGGEAQRLRLATQVGSSLVGVLYVLDEPSIGLHPRDHQKLLGIIQELRDRGNTVILVEHDEDTIKFADYVVDLGPRAGKEGGYIIAKGTPQEIAVNPESITGQYLSGQKKIPLPAQRRNPSGQWLELKGATGNNLKNVNLKIPLGTLTVVSGVSGSGKSTLIMDTLYKILGNHFYDSNHEVEPYREIKGLDFLDKVIDINQRPIGRTPRSTPATYVGLFPLIRDLFAQLPESKLRGYLPGRFSFNLKGGRCENCQGQGENRLEMHFLSDVFVGCEICQGRRYNAETLRVQYKGKSISDILSMNVAEALDFFKNHSLIYRKLETLHQVGLDYISLGQSSTTLSGGEAQRIKLSRELSKRSTGKTLYILDEPTTGLHFDDVRKLCELLQKLTDQGNTVLVIEHNLEVIKIADYVVDLGPEGGNLGGYIVAEGSPEQIIRSPNSATGLFLKSVLNSSAIV